MKNIFLLAVILIFQKFGYAATVDTVSISSIAMHKTMKCVVIKPGVYKKKHNTFPVVYLLHGYSGDFSNWITKVPALKAYADQYQLMIVCPDGDYSSWYFDSPVDAAMKYETYIAKEVPAYIDARYKTIKDRSARAITGLSMGGHGGLFLGFRHAETFGACGSMSGGVDLDAVKKKFDVMKRLGDTIQNKKYWDNWSVINVVEQYPKDSITVIFDCGTEDFFYKDNHHLHEKMLQLKIPHDYIERPGMHNWVYWANAVQYQLLFFNNFFDRIKTS